MKYFFKRFGQPVGVALTLLLLGAWHAHSQSTAEAVQNAPETVQKVSGSASPLPDAPSATRATETASGSANMEASATMGEEAAAGSDAERAPAYAKSSSAVPAVAPKFAHTIQPGQIAEPLTVGDKFIYSVRDRPTLPALADSLWRAGWEHAINGKPHYGTDSGAFGDRLGTSVLKQTVSHFLTNGVFASLLHDDPRYYRLGDEHSIAHRAVCAASRVVVTRTDDGRPVANIPRLAATASVAALNNLYYPAEDCGVRESVLGGLTSLALKAAGYELSEFTGDLLHILHRKRQ